LNALKCNAPRRRVALGAANVPALEAETDRLVVGLYGLAEEFGSRKARKGIAKGAKGNREERERARTELRISGLARLAG